MIVSARPGASVGGGGQHRDQHHVGLAQHADGLDRDEFRVAWPDAHPDQPLLA